MEACSWRDATESLVSMYRLAREVHTRFDPPAQRSPFMIERPRQTLGTTTGPRGPGQTSTRIP